MKKIKELFMVIFTITMTTSVYAQTGWVGKWTGKGAKSINAELHLFSDSTFFYAFSVTLSSSDRKLDGTYLSAKYSMWAMYQGTWEGEKDHLYLSVDRSNSDGDIIHSQGLNNWDRLALIQAGAASFEDVSHFDFDVISRKGNTVTVDWNDMTLTKTNVSTPYYYVPPKTGKFELLDKTSSFLVFGVYTAPNGNRTVGYWDRDGEPISEETSSISRTFDKEGNVLLSTTGSDEYRLDRINNTADMLFRAPESGLHEFTYTDGRQYNGMWEDHYPNGQGLMRYPDGDTKEGTWENGKFIEGTVTMIDSYGKYVGEYKDGDYNGQGRYEFADNYYDIEKNRVKEGLWQNGEFIEGIVTRFYTHGNDVDTIVCEYKDGQMKGKGKYTYANGSWEEGIFDGTKLISGNVSIKNKNGGTYTGEVKNNKRDGNGTYTKGDLVVTGVWANDIIQQGKLSCPDYTYEGTFSNGKFLEGTYQFRTMILTGIWKNQIFERGDFKLTLSNDNAIKSAQGKYDEKFYGLEGYKDIIEAICEVDQLKLSGKYQSGLMEWTITYPNNDQYFGYYNGSYCYLSEINKEFKYTWADGTSATGIVDKKHKPTKLSFTNSAGEPIKGKDTKRYVMQFPGSDETVNLPYGVYKSWEIMQQLFQQQITVPETGELYF